MHLPPTASPIAQAYAGHQFGYFNMLGDGRAILLGELTTPNSQIFDLQLKGSGITKYSRGGDGKCALNSALREYIYSESMHALDISTTRSLAVVGTGSPVFREVMQDGAVLTRIAKSHIRVGTFAYIAKFGTITELQALVDYTVNRHFTEIKNEPNKAIALLQAVIELQIKLIVQWMRVGFIHGVMNTDNMSISGQTIDYGPCAFMNTYNPATVYSRIDANGRYAFAQQAPIAHWNLVRFAETLLPLVHSNPDEAIKTATTILENINTIFEKEYFSMMHGKIGLKEISEEGKNFIASLLNWMQLNQADYTNTFLQLMQKEVSQDDIYQSREWKNMVLDWGNLLLKNASNKQEAIALMQKYNPNYIPRNTNMEALINNCIETGSNQELEYFLEKMKDTYSEKISDTKICSYLPEENYSTHCNT